MVRNSLQLRMRLISLGHRLAPLWIAISRIVAPVSVTILRRSVLAASALAPAALSLKQ